MEEMICDFCGKIKDELPKRWINNEINEEYKICDACVQKIKDNKFKE